MDCAEAVAVPLNVCLACGGSVLEASVNREDFAVECGPVLSLTSRQKTGELLAGLFPGLEARSVSQALTQKVRVVGGLSQMTAEALTKAIGPQATGAHVVRGRATRRGMGAFFRRGLPFVGVGAGALLGLLWNPLGWAIGGGVAVAGGLFNAGQPIPTLAEAPVGPVLDTALSEAARAFVAPPQNVVFMDTEGKFGYQMPGRYPRRDHTGMFPAPGDGSGGGGQRWRLGLIGVAGVGSRSHVRDLLLRGVCGFGGGNETDREAKHGAHRVGVVESALAPGNELLRRQLRHRRHLPKLKLSSSRDSRELESFD